jgi:protein-tyrosine phosphatase
MELISANRYPGNCIQEDFQRFDRIYAMANDVMKDMKQIGGAYFDESKTDFLLNEIYPGQNRNVPDPWYGNEDGYIEVFELLEKACDAVIENHYNSIQKEATA